MSDDQIVARFYTRARKFPRLLGVTHEGMKIPGGPYTGTQAVVGAAAVFVLSKTAPLWATGGLIKTGLTGGLVVWIAVFVVGKLPSPTTNPLWVVAGIFGLTLTPNVGKQRGKRIETPRPHQMRGHYVLDLDEDVSMDASEPVPEPVPELAPEPVKPAPVQGQGSSVSELLAMAVQAGANR